MTNNTNVGFSSGASTTGSNNTVVGASSGSNASGTNQNNTIVGYSSANNLAGSSNLTIIGSGVTVANGVSNSIALGNTMNVTQSNTAYLGSTSITQMVSSATYASASDRRLKTNITPSHDGLDFINRLKPVEYSLKSNSSHQIGFIAQDVEAVDPNYPAIVKPTAANPYYALTYSTFIPTLVNAVQKLDMKIQTLKSDRAMGTNQKTDALRPYSNVVLLVMSMLVLISMCALNAYTWKKLNSLKD